MEINNINGSTFQSHFIPAEKPHEYYLNVVNEETRLCKLIGTIINVRYDDIKKEYRYDNDAVFRLYDRNKYVFHDAVVADFTGFEEPFEVDQLTEAVSMCNLRRIFSFDIEYNEGSMLYCSEFVQCTIMMLNNAGFSVPLDNKERFVNQKGRIEGNHLIVEDNVVLYVDLDEKPWDVVANLASQIKAWDYIDEFMEPTKSPREISVVMESDTEQIEELFRLANKLNKTIDVFDKESFLFCHLCRLREKIGRNTTTLGEIRKAAARAFFENDWKCLIEGGLIYIDGEDVRFSDFIERVIKWGL